MTEKQIYMKYLHKYKSVDNFKTDYYGSYYHEPWVSIHPGDKIMTCTLWDDEYYDTLKYLGPTTAKYHIGGEGESEGTIDVPGYLWDLSPQGDTTRYLFEDENPGIGTKYMYTWQEDGEVWVGYSSFDNASDHIYDIKSIAVDENAVRYNKRKVDLEASLNNGCSWSEGCRVGYMEANPEFGIYQEVYNGGSGEGEGEDCSSYYVYYASGTGINPDNLESFTMRFWLNGEPVELDMVKSIYDGQAYWPTNLVAPYGIYVRIEEFYADPGKFAINVHYSEGN